MKKYILIFSMFLILCSCGTEKEVRIGAIIPLTGPVATYGQDLKKGIDLAFLGNDIYSIIYEDDKANATAGVSAMKKLHDFNGVRLFIGCATTTVTLAIAEEAQKSNSILLVPIATGDAIKDIGNNIFMHSPRNEKQAIAAFNFIKDNYNLERVGVLYQQNSYGTGLSSVFIKQLRNEEIEPLFSESYQDAQTQIRSILSKIKESNPDAIFIPAEYQPTAIILKQAMELGINTVFIGTDGAYSSKLFEIAGEATENFYLTMFPLDKQNHLYQEFHKEYFKQYNDDPNVFTCYGYETARTLINALENTDRTVEEVREYLYENEFNSISGSFRFDEKGEIIREYGIYTIRDSNFEIVK